MFQKFTNISKESMKIVPMNDPQVKKIQESLLTQKKTKKSQSK